MKSINEWYLLLPEKIANKAIQNCDKLNPDVVVLWFPCESLPSAIIQGFVWQKTPEGYDYWLAVFERAKAGEFNKPQNP